MTPTTSPLSTFFLKPHGARARIIATALPISRRHITVTTNDPLFIVGDVHGCADELRLLLKQKPKEVLTSTLYSFLTRRHCCGRLTRSCVRTCLQCPASLVLSCCSLAPPPILLFCFVLLLKGGEVFFAVITVIHHKCFTLTFPLPW